MHPPYMLCRVACPNPIQPHWLSCIDIASIYRFQVLDFYSHWSNFVTTMSFGWADVYDVREAPNRIVKRSVRHYLYRLCYVLMADMGGVYVVCRAIEKENKKARDEAKRKYQDKVRALVAFVKGMDPRVMKIEADRRKRKAEEDAQRAEQK